MGAIDQYPSSGFSTANAVLGYAEVTASQGSITTEVDLTGLSVTVSIPAGRKIRVSGSAYFTNTGTTGYDILKIQQDGVQVMERGQAADTDAHSVECPVILSPSAGPHTYKLRALTTAGTVTFNAGATFPAYILVEDVTGGTGGSGPIQLAYAEAIADQASITTVTDLTGLTATVSVPSGRRIKITGYVASVVTTVAADIARLSLKEGATLLQLVQQTVTQTNGTTVKVEWVGTPTAGTHTYKLTLERQSGTGSLTAVEGATYPAFILVEDITGTPMSVENLAWIDYIPTLTQGVTVTKTVTYARYTRVGRTIFAQGALTCTSAGTAATYIQIGRPTSSVNTGGGNMPIGTASLYDSSANLWYKALAAVAATSTFYLQPTNGTTAGFLGNDTFTAALASGDIFGFNIMYEADS